MRQEDIIKFFKHVASRESSHRLKDAFRFKKVLTSQKKGMLDSPKYKDPDRNPTLSIAPAATPAQTYTFRFHNEVSDSAAVIEQQNTETEQHDTTAPAPSRIRPRPKHKNVVNDKTSGRSTPSGIVPDVLSGIVPGTTSGIVPNSVQPLLTLDPEYQRDPEIQLDPSLEPDFGRLSSMDGNDLILTPWMGIPNATLPATTSTSRVPPVPDISNATVPETAIFNATSVACMNMTPASKRPAPEPARMSQRLKGKSDLLAIEQAKGKGKKRR